MSRFKQLSLVLVGCLLTFFGLIGLLLPIAPGILLLLLAVVCFATASSRIRKRLHKNPRFGPYAKHWELSQSLPLAQRAQLGCWLLWAAATDLLRPASARRASVKRY